MENILIVKFRALGDTVIGLAAVQYLRETFPAAQIHYAVPQWTAPLFKHVKLDQVNIVPIQLRSVVDFFRFYRTCAQLKPDCIFELQQRGTTGKFFKLFSKIKHIKYYFHNHHIKTPGFVLDQGINKPVIQRDLDGVWSGINDMMPDQFAVPNFLDYPLNMPLASEVTKDDSIVIGVVATRQTKMWPIQHYGTLIRLIIDRGVAQKVIIPLSNMPKDIEIEQQLNQLELPQEVDIIKQPLDQLTRTLAKCQKYIGNDTGLKHICIGLGLETYTFFGPEPPKEWHPYDTRYHTYFYRENLDCRTIKKHFCDLSWCDSMICLNHFTPEAVFKRIFNS